MTYTSTDPITKARNTIFASFRAETVTYTDKDGLEHDVAIIVNDQDASLQDPAPAGDSLVVFVKAADIVHPGYQDTITLDGETWHVRRNLSGGPHTGIWKLEVSRSERRWLS